MGGALPNEAYQIVELFEPLGQVFSIEAAGARISELRKRPLHIIQKRVDRALLGLCFSSDEAAMVDPYDLIVVAPGLTFACFTMSSYVVEINLLQTIFTGERYRSTLNDLYFGFLTAGSVATVLVMLPQSVLVLIVERNKRRTLLEAKRYLHPKYLAVAPGGMYRPGDLTAARIDVELEHARYVLWTHEPRTKPIAPEDEAGLLFDCIRKGMCFRSTGQCDPMPTRDEIDTHFLHVAEALRRLEITCSVLKAEL